MHGNLEKAQTGITFVFSNHPTIPSIAFRIWRAAAPRRCASGRVGFIFAIPRPSRIPLLRNIFARRPTVCLRIAALRRIQGYVNFLRTFPSSRPTTNSCDSCGENFNAPICIRSCIHGVLLQALIKMHNSWYSRSWRKRGCASSSGVLKMEISSKEEFPFLYSTPTRYIRQGK